MLFTLKEVANMFFKSVYNKSASMFSSSKSSILRADIPEELSILKKNCSLVQDFHSNQLKLVIQDLHQNLRDFRQKHGFGRAIAAPQLGHNIQVIALNLGMELNYSITQAIDPFTIINPKITWKSDKTFTMFDDCLSFPGLLYKVKRHHSIQIIYYDENGNERQTSKLPQSLSELLQHEIDHLNGILMSDRSDEKPITRKDYEQNTFQYNSQVDYYIPTFKKN